MSIRNFCLLAAIIALPACGKKPVEPAAPPAPRPASGVSLDAPGDTPAPPPPAPAPDAPAPEAAANPVYQAIPVDPNIQAALGKFFNDNARPAQNWKELLDGHYISRIPQGTDGKPLDWNKTMEEIGKRR